MLFTAVWEREGKMAGTPKEEIKRIADQFAFTGELVSCGPCGSGHINETYMLRYRIGEMGSIKVILQKINREIFQKPEELMENIAGVTGHLKKKVLQKGGDPEREVLNLIPTKDGKGGVGYILETKFGLNLPPKMREAMGYAAKAVSDHKHKELHPDEIFSLFKSTFENVVEPYSISEVHFQQKEDGIVTRVTSTFRGKTIVTEASGNGRLDAVSNALKKAYELKYTLETYQEHALEQSSSSKAIAYVGIRKPDGTLAWGAGVDQDIIRASIDALVTAINNR